MLPLLFTSHRILNILELTKQVGSPGFELIQRPTQRWAVAAAKVHVDWVVGVP